MPFRGVSPRERGNLDRLFGHLGSVGCIPARAGEPGPPARPLGLHRVYPRASGGTLSAHSACLRAVGVSPRERGNRHLLPRAAGRVGCIPARAGEPRSRCSRRRRPGVYPRASGGTLVGIAGARIAEGVSPRERGNLLRDDPIGLLHGCIPARAGEPKTSSASRRLTRVYPRASGGTGPRASERRAWRGVSPRERGNPNAEYAAGTRVGCIPARAGEPLGRQRPVVRGRVYPRASGGTSQGREDAGVAPGVSPRERGNLPMRLAATLGIGCIPARAGEPPAGRLLDVAERVYPRASGGTEDNTKMIRDPQGVSPRERGNPVRGPGLHALQRCIPARAGEPRYPAPRR